MLTKETVIDKIEILETGHIQVRRATYFLEDGKRIFEAKYHRSSYNPGDDISQEDQKVKNHAVIAWTPKVIVDYKASLLENVKTI